MTQLPRSKHPIGPCNLFCRRVVSAPSIGPALGGYVSDNFGWQSIYLPEPAARRGE